MEHTHAREVGGVEGYLVHQLLMKSFGARRSAEQKLIAQQPSPCQSLNLTKEIGSFKTTGTINKICFVEAKA